jgi:VanZ family protein
VFAMSINTVPPLFKLIMMQDKVAHAFAYATLMAWFAQIFRHDLTRLLLVIGLAMFGLGMELAQGMVPERQFDYKDMAANTMGIVCSWALAYTWVGNMFVKAEKMYARLRILSPIRI